jgi:hypothetical protein
MPVRRIPVSSRSVTGRALVAGDQVPVDFESTLERDFIALVSFSPRFLRIEEQPLRLEYRVRGQTHHYTPDFLVELSGRTHPAKTERRLIEIKYQRDLKERRDEYADKFLAARAYARRRRWQFVVLSELEIRGPYLNNARFLARYRRIESDEVATRLLLDRLTDLREADAETLLISVYRDSVAQATILPFLWHLVATRRIQTDLTQLLTMRSRLWVADDAPVRHDWLGHPYTVSL